MNKKYEDKKLIETLTGNPDLVIDSGLDFPPQNPFELLGAWFETALALKICEPYGITLGTVNSDGHPSTRVVLLKDFDERGLFFATSAESNKGKDFEGNPWASCTIWWRETVQQINCRGIVRRLSASQSNQMFKERSRSAQAVACMSQQSSVLEDEGELRNQVNALIAKMSEIQRPAHWHGYVLELNQIEFWHGSADRFHKRLRYELVNGSWNHVRLQP